MSGTWRTIQDVLTVWSFSAARPAVTGDLHLDLQGETPEKFTLQMEMPPSLSPAPIRQRAEAPLVYWG